MVKLSSYQFYWAHYRRANRAALKFSVELLAQTKSWIMTESIKKCIWRTSNLSNNAAELILNKLPS